MVKEDIFPSIDSIRSEEQITKMIGEAL